MQILIIIQFKDYYCDLSPIQQQLYEDFSKLHIRKQISETETEDSHTSNKNNMLQVIYIFSNYIFIVNSNL